MNETYFCAQSTRPEVCGVACTATLPDCNGTGWCMNVSWGGAICTDYHTEGESCGEHGVQHPNLCTPGLVCNPPTSGVMGASGTCARLTAIIDVLRSDAQLTTFMSLVDASGML